MAPMNWIERQDPQLWAAIAGEIDRQRNSLEMIASENYASPARNSKAACTMAQDRKSVV